MLARPRACLPQARTLLTSGVKRHFLGEGPPGKPSQCRRLLEALSPQVHRGGISASTSTRAGWRAPQPGSPRTAVVPPPSPSLPSLKKFSALPDVCDGLSTFRGQLRYLQVRRAKFLKPAMSLTSQRVLAKTLSWYLVASEARCAWGALDPNSALCSLDP